MTELTREQVAALLDGTTPGPWAVEIGNVPIADTGDYDGYCRLMAGGRIIFEQWGDDEQSEKDATLAGAAPDLARQLLAAMDRLADADMAQAALVERAAEVVPHGWCQPETSNTVMDVELGMAIQKCIRRVAPDAGVKDLAALRAERDAALSDVRVWMLTAQLADQRAADATADNSLLAAELAEARKQVEALREAVIWCSGSNDFHEGGVAHKGWLKLCAPLIHPAAESDPPCTDCDDTGITKQTERYCTCDAGAALAAAEEPKP